MGTAGPPRTIWNCAAVIRDRAGTSLVFETKELEETPGCIWAQFAAPTAVSLSAPPRAINPAGGAPAALLALLLLAVTTLGLRARSAR